MNNLSIKHRYPNVVEAMVKKAVQSAIDFMTARYNGDRFVDMHIDVSFKATESLYDREAMTARIAVKKTWSGMEVGVELGIALGVVRHMTNHIQHIEKRVLSEIEVNKNELDYLSECDAKWGKVIEEQTKKVTAAYKQWKKVRK